MNCCRCFSCAIGVLLAYTPDPAIATDKLIVFRSCVMAT
jgi:hypothetical protein